MNIPALLTESALQLDIGGHAPANHKWHAALCHLARDLHDERVYYRVLDCPAQLGQDLRIVRQLLRVLFDEEQHRGLEPREAKII
jgi:hypothetical protein